MPGVEERVVTGPLSPTLRVVGVGFGRTGTLSLREALVRLGFGPGEQMRFSRRAATGVAGLLTLLWMARCAHRKCPKAA